MALLTQAFPDHLRARWPGIWLLDGFDLSIGGYRNLRCYTSLDARRSQSGPRAFGIGGLGKVLETYLDLQEAARY